MKNTTKKPKTLLELKEIAKPIKNVNHQQKEKQSKLDRFAVKITNKVGTMNFFLIILSWTILWLSWNILSPSNLKFDPVPACVFWLFLSNMIQIFLMPLIMIGQNIQSKHAEARADANFETTLKSEEEIETILIHLQDQNEAIDQILSILKETK